MIPLCIPSIGADEIKAVNEVLKSGWLAHGPKNEEFEEAFAKFIGIKHAISMNSCTSALYLVIKALGIKGEVIVPSFTFVASVNAVVTAGADPVFVDIDYNTCNIDPSKIENSITNRTEAIMPVHFGGQSCDMKPIMKIACKLGLAVIEDSAETIGGEYNGKKTGSFGIGCFSFYPTKNITTGEGGILTTDDDQLAEKIRAMVGHGISSTTFKREKSERPWFRSAIYPGYNFRMSNILAVIGVEQIKKLGAMNQKRVEHSRYLNNRLKSVGVVDLPVESSSCKHVYQMYTVKIKGINRDKFVHALNNEGIGASVHFDPPVHLQSYYKPRFQNLNLPVTEKVAKTIVTIPMYPQLKKAELDKIAKAVISISGE